MTPASTPGRQFDLPGPRSPAGALPVPRFSRALLLAAATVCLADANPGTDQTEASSPNKPSAPSVSSDDGWPDASGFLDRKYGFLPVVMPITEPAVGYGAAGGLAFISKPLPEANQGLARPNITMVGAMGTENGSWGAMAADIRYWYDGRLQTIAGLLYSSVNLDFYGIGNDTVLAQYPLQYNLEPKGGRVQARHRLGGSAAWVGLNYAFAVNDVRFDAPAGTAGLPDFTTEANVGALTPSFTYDTRDNIFTPTAGTYLESGVGLFSTIFGGDDEFQRLRLIAMQFLPVAPGLYLGVRGEAGAAFGDVPFYLEPFIYLRGAPIMRYQGEAIAQAETELRWQFWQRLSLIGFLGGGAAWNGLEQFDNTETVITGGTGFRYEIARRYGIHTGLDLAFGPDNTAVYVQVGSAWARP